MLNPRFAIILLTGALFLTGCASSPKTTETAATAQPTPKSAETQAMPDAAPNAAQPDAGAIPAESAQTGENAVPETAEKTDPQTPTVPANADAQQVENAISLVLLEGAENAQDITHPEANDPQAPQTQETTPEQPADIDYAAKRREALAAMRSHQSPDATEFWSYVDNDPLMTQTLDSEVKPHGTNSISALGGGSTVSLKYVDTADASAKAALKPDQDLRQTMYRSEIAYYRLCQILECSFDTPVTRPVRFSESDFNALYNASSSSKNKGYRSKFDHLIWEKENGKKYLYAAYKEWISPFDGFPIEASNIWSPFLQNPNADVPGVERFLHRLLAAGRPEDGRNQAKFIEYMGQMTTRDLLQQISDLILIDYLTNNWDRFAGEVNNYGANCHFQPGGIIAIDNGAAFPAWHAPRVVRRLNLVQMFSRNLVQNLRMLDEDELLGRLFPNPTKEEKKSLARFKERRRDALKYIDGLIQKKGEDKVLVF